MSGYRPKVDPVDRPIDGGHQNQSRGEGSSSDKRSGSSKRKREVMRWSAMEEAQLRRAVEIYGADDWNEVAEMLQTRSSRQCKEHYTEVLSPDVKHGAWAAEEEMALVKRHAQFGSSWTSIAQALPGRPANACKNKFNGTLRRKGTEDSVLAVYITYLYQNNKLQTDNHSRMRALTYATSYYCARFERTNSSALGNYPATGTCWNYMDAGTPQGMPMPPPPTRSQQDAGAASQPQNERGAAATAVVAERANSDTNGMAQESSMPPKQSDASPDLTTVMPHNEVASVATHNSDPAMSDSVAQRHGFPRNRTASAMHSGGPRPAAMAAPGSAHSWPTAPGSMESGYDYAMHIIDQVADVGAASVMEGAPGMDNFGFEFSREHGVPPPHMWQPMPYGGNQARPSNAAGAPGPMYHPSDMMLCPPPHCVPPPGYGWPPPYAGMSGEGMYPPPPGWGPYGMGYPMGPSSLPWGWQHPHTSGMDPSRAPSRPSPRPTAILSSLSRVKPEHRHGHHHRDGHGMPPAPAPAAGDASAAHSGTKTPVPVPERPQCEASSTECPSAPTAPLRGSSSGGPFHPSFSPAPYPPYYPYPVPQMSMSHPGPHPGQRPVSDREGGIAPHHHTM